MARRNAQHGFEPSPVGIAEATALAAVEWTWNRYGPRCCLLSSMQDAVLIDLAMRVTTEIPVVFLDNGYHFESTLETLARVEHRYDIDVEVIRSPFGRRGDVLPGECCDVKPALLDEALSDRDAWMSGIQRCQTPHRSDITIVSTDRRGKTKVSPLAQWNDGDRAEYIADRDVITHRLLSEGYTSVGCEPCTDRPLADARSGRWAQSDRTECGLHL